MTYSMHIQLRNHNLNNKQMLACNHMLNILYLFFAYKHIEFALPDLIYQATSNIKNQITPV